MKRFTATGSIACFFEQPWSRISPALTETDQAWLLGGAAYSLRALGRLIEALEPTRAALEMCVKRADWMNAVRSGINLSQLELALGEVALAVADAEQYETYAERIGNSFESMANRATYADALHQAGRRGEAEARFREAEAMQAEGESEYRLLYSQRGFHYCAAPRPRRARRLATLAQFILHPSSFILPGILPRCLRARGADAPVG